MRSISTLLLIIALLFVGCNNPDDNDETERSPVGRWLQLNGSDNNHDGITNDYYYEITSNSWSHFIDEGSNSYYIDSAPCTISGNEIVISYDDGGNDVYTVTFSFTFEDDNLIITGLIDDGPDTFQMTLAPFSDELPPSDWEL